MSVVSEVVDNNAVDLIVAENELQDGKISDLTRRIRHHEAGDNPFLVVITLMEELTSEAINNVIDSGTDDLLTKPISPALLIERVESLTRERKRFVVTTDYVGPTRRRKSRPGSQEIPEFKVPNSLQLKAAGLYDAERYRRRITEIARIIIGLGLFKKVVVRSTGRSLRQCGHLISKAGMIAENEAGSKGVDGKK